MTKLSIKPFWVLALLAGAATVTYKLAVAYTAFSPAAAPIGFVAQDDLTNYNLTSGQETLYRGQYEKEYWSGNLIAYRVDSTGDVTTATQPWIGGAADQLDQLAPAERRIATLKSDGTKIPFEWGTLSSAQQTDIGSSLVMDFLRGDRSEEIQNGGSLRHRASALGDIIHSRPLYIADASNPTVFIGANDGMLHAIDAATGVERWAYVPSMLIPRLKNLAVQPYVHNYYVDGSATAANILNNTKRVLAGVLGAGGKGVFGLDITGSSRLAPATASDAAANILWEITPTTISNNGVQTASTAYANLGYTYANPTLAKVGSTDAVIVGNGYNDGGDYQAYLYIINANTGALIRAIKAGTSGSSTSPNGLSTSVAVDTNNDGTVETAYAGDLNGTLWKFDLGAGTATALYTTSPAQPITMSPGVSQHPSGGYMINFATGAMLTSSDMTSTAVSYAYGIWDGAPATNTTMLTQTLSTACYSSGASAPPSPCVDTVRTVTANAADWTVHKGWKVALPAGEKVVGDGSFVENGRFYFNAYNPTVSTAVQSSTVYGENWLMELDYLTGGVSNSPFLDLSGNHVLTDDDRIKSSSSPYGPIMTTSGIPVGKKIGIGVMSQPVLVQLSTLNNTLFNQNPDVTIVPVDLTATHGVAGGHFDVDIFYGSTTSSGASATATLTIGNTGQVAGVPATLGNITVDGTVVVPAMTVVDLADGNATSTNATTIAGKVTNGFTASRSGSVITLTAPKGSQFNGKTISIGAGTSQTPVSAAVPAVTGNKAVGSISFTYASSNSSKTVNNLVISINGETLYSGNPGSKKPKDLDDLLDGKSSANYTMSKDYNNNYTVKITAKNTGANWNGTVNVTMSVTSGDNPNYSKTNVAGGTSSSPGQAASGWTNFAPAIAATTFNNSGSDPAVAGDNCTSNCQYKTHFHQYDDIFDVTGVNMLNPSSTTLNIKNGIPSLTQNFKVIVQNQYLNPSAKLHIGDPGYLYNVDFGYIYLKNYNTSSTLDLAQLQTYRRDPSAVWPGSAVTDAQKLAQPKPIGSLTVNMPTDALSAKDWWGNGDIRVGLHPTVYRCVWKSAGSNDGNMYMPVIPPANGVAGKGTNGWSSSTTPATATGARHNGALVIQIIKDTTPNSAIEQNVLGRPEYGWRVKSASYSTYVLAEYAVYWHHPNGICYGETGWSKTPGADDGASDLQNKAPGSTDPKIGELGGAGGGGTVIIEIVSSSTTTVGDVTTTILTYSDGVKASIVRTVNANGTVTIVTTDHDGKVTSQTVANMDGSLRTGGDERGLRAAKTGRLSWRQLVAP
jgi:hypothetical protein